MTNAGQLARALQMYAQDYDDHLPQASSWVTSTGRYIRTIPASRTPALRCPSVPGTDPSAIGYAFNAELSGKSRASVGALALARLVYDTTSKAPNASDAVTTLPNPPRHAQRQFRRASLPFNVIAYADGHVKAVNALGVALPAPQNRRGR